MALPTLPFPWMPRYFIDKLHDPSHECGKPPRGPPHPFVDPKILTLGYQSPEETRLSTPSDDLGSPASSHKSFVCLSSDDRTAAVPDSAHSVSAYPSPDPTVHASPDFPTCPLCGFVIKDSAPPRRESDEELDSSCESETSEHSDSFDEFLVPLDSAGNFDMNPSAYGRQREKDIPTAMLQTFDVQMIPMTEPAFAAARSASMTKDTSVDQAVSNSQIGLDANARRTGQNEAIGQARSIAHIGTSTHVGSIAYTESAMQATSIRKTRPTEKAKIAPTRIRSTPPSAAPPRSMPLGQNNMPPPRARPRTSFLGGRNFLSQALPTQVMPLERRNGPYSIPKNVVDPTAGSQHNPLSQVQNRPDNTFTDSSPNLEAIGQTRSDRKDVYAVRTHTGGSKSIVKLPSLPSNPFQTLPSQQTIFADSSTNELEEEDRKLENTNGVRQEMYVVLTNLVKQMMFVSGEQTEPSAETTWMIEEIVREQVVEMLKEATVLANRRGSKSITIVDLIFQIRHNTAKVSRLKTFLSWKDVRKNVKDSDDKAGGADDVPDLEDGALPGANPSAPQKSSTNKKAKLILPWEVQSFYNETVPEREDEEDEEEEEQNEATLARLASADERTKNMTREEYVYWSDCRQASFTFRKGKRFREWAGFGTIIDSKPNDDVVDILGFLTFEIVQTLTEEALKVKAAEDLANKKASVIRSDIEATKKRKREGCTLFEMPEEGRTPVEPKHVREAFRRLQIVPNKYKFMRQGFAGVRTPLRMI